LQTSVERLEGDRVRLTVTVPAAEVDAEIANAYARIGAKLRIPGFRPGKAPRPVVDTHVGKETVLTEAQEEIVSNAYGRAVSENDIRNISQPDVGELDMIVPGEDFTFTAELQLRPELTLSGLDDLKVSVPAQKASDREIDAQIEYTRERFATLETVEAAAGENDFALISFTGTVDGEPYEGNVVDKYLYELGRGLMPAEFDAAIVGASAGTEAVAEFVVPDTSSNDEYVGKTARFEITVHEVKSKVLPELNDEFATSVGGFDTLEEYRADVREKLDSSKESGHARAVENAVLALLVGRLEGEVPEELVQGRSRSMFRDFAESIEQRGVELGQYLEMTGTTPDRLEADITAEARTRLAEEFALEALFRAQELTVSDRDVDEAVREMVKGDDAEAERMKSTLTTNGALPIVREQIMHRKALKWLMDAVEVTEEEQS
jgi:trigger factor